MSDHTSSRRNFLISSSAAAAIAAGAKFTFAADASAPASSAAKPHTPGKPHHHEQKPLATTKTKYSQINVACIGLEGRGRGDLEGVVNAGANVVALCDIDLNKLAKTSHELPDARTYTDYRELIAKEGNKIDAVVIATPDHNHAAATMLAINAGKHVYCEKPLTHTIYEARVVTEAARKRGVKTQMGNQGAAVPAERRQVDYVKSGIVGNIKEVHVYTNRPTGVWPQGILAPTGHPDVPANIKWNLWLGPAASRAYNPAYLPFKWRGFWDFGTGALGDMACHLMFSAHWALNLSNATRIESFSDGKTVDSPPLWSIIKWDFPELNGRPPVKMFWYDGEMLPPPWLMNGKTFPGDHNGSVFVGEKGNIAAPYMGEPFLVNEKQQKELPAPPKVLPDSIGHHAEWLEAILTPGAPVPASNFDVAGPLTETVLVGNLSVRAGRHINWDAKKMRAKDDKEAQSYVKIDYRDGWSL